MSRIVVRRIVVSRIVVSRIVVSTDHGDEAYLDARPANDYRET